MIYHESFHYNNFCFIFSGHNHAQSQQSVAIVDSSKFDDKTNGILRLVRANTMMGSIDTECTFRCQNVKKEADSLRKEIDDLKCKNLPLGDRQERLKGLDSEYERMKFASEKTYKHYANVLMAPVYDDIREMTKKFALSHGYSVMVDKSSVIFDSSILTGIEHVPDVTSEFIKFCNESFEQKKKY